MRKLKIILQCNWIYYGLLIIGCLWAFYQTQIREYQSILTNQGKIVGKVIQYKFDGAKLSLILSVPEKINVIYYMQSAEEKKFFMDKIVFGLEITVEGTLEKPKNNSISNTFNYKEYLYQRQIHWLFKANKIIIDNNNVGFGYKIKNWVMKRAEKVGDKDYIKAFVLGIKDDIDPDVFNSYQNNGVTHLFAISGMHIGLLSAIILKLLKKMRINEEKSYFLVILLLGGYGFLVGFPASILRAFLLFSLITINKIYRLQIPTINLLILAVVIAIIINPFIIYDIGFLYSVSTSAGLILAHKFINSGNYWWQLLKISFIANLCSMPITINNFYSINLFSLFNNLIIVPLISIIIYPLTLLTFCLPFMDVILHFFILILETVSMILSQVKIFTFVIPKWPIIVVFIYYCMVWLFIKNNKMKYILMIILLTWLYNLILNFDSNSYVYYLDVGQGDSSLIISSYRNDVILIDTGGKIIMEQKEWTKSKKEFHLIDNTITFIKSFGIDHIDKLVLSHGDYDHMGEAINLVDNFRVENVIFNCGEYNDLEKKLIDILDRKQIKYYSCIKELNVDKYKLEFLNTGTYDDENDNSNVIYFNYNNYKFLFMGDASVEREKDILKKFNLSNIDFLKVGHHGSNTSSSEEFINQINPKYSLISVGKNNRYGHPKESVLDILKDSKVYRTDKDGSIEIKLNKDGYKISTCPP